MEALVLRLERELESDRKDLAEFAKDLVSNNRPLYQLSISSNLCRVAARVQMNAEILGAIEGGASKESIRDTLLQRILQYTENHKGGNIFALADEAEAAVRTQLYQHLQG